MRGHIIAEDKFLHMGIDHHLFVMQVDGAEHEYRFEVRRTAPGAVDAETIYEKTEDLSDRLSGASETDIGEILSSELAVIKQEIFDEEDLHIHDP
jgi:hypothetical protein